MSTRHWFAPIAVALLGGGICAAQSAEPAQWMRHDIPFNYLPMTTTYSCIGLERKLRALLSISGAREDMQVTTSGCARGAGVPDKFARARLVFYALRPANAAEKDANAEPAGTANGEWRRVRLGIRPVADLEVGDCELIEQFRHSVLSTAFSVRAISEPAPCVPFQRSTGAFSLNFEVFAAPRG
jgi:hypothetical protein